MSATLNSLLSTTLSSSSSLQVKRLGTPARSTSLGVIFKPQRICPSIRAATTDFSSSLDTGLSTELDVVTSYSEIVPDTVVFDDFERFPPTAATVSSSLILGICSLPDTKFRSVVDTALADSECYGLGTSDDRISCFFDKALVNVGGDLAKLVPGRVSTEVDARLAYDKQAIVGKLLRILGNKSCVLGVIVELSKIGMKKGTNLPTENFQRPGGKNGDRRISLRPAKKAS